MVAYYATGIFVIPVLIFALIAQAKVKSNYKKYSKIASRSGMTGAMAAWRLLQLNGITDVTIQPIKGNLTDNYNPTNKVISLSEGVYNSTSIAAIGIACHEAGHACQHAKGYAPLKFRNMVIPVTKIGSWVGVPLVIIGVMLSYYATQSDIGYLLAVVGLFLYAFVALFQLITLPVEFDASKRALQTIQDNAFLTPDEFTGAKKVLSAAALTYVAALASSLVTLLRLFIIVAGRKR